MQQVFDVLQRCTGVDLKDDPQHLIYPMPLDAAGTDAIYVGRIRRDDSVENGINFWCVADNIRKGAATNAVQILAALQNRAQ